MSDTVLPGIHATDRPESPVVPDSGGGWFELHPATKWTVRRSVEVEGVDRPRRIRLDAGTHLRLVAFWPPLEAGNWCVWQMAWSAQALLVLDGPDADAGVIVAGGDYSPLPRETFIPEPASTGITTGAPIASTLAQFSEACRPHGDNAQTRTCRRRRG